MIPLYGRLKGSKGISFGLGLDEIQIDFTKFKPGIIAIQGDNGVGKSTIMKLMLHPYLMCTGSKKKIQEHFQLRNSEKEFVCIQDGIKYRSLVLIDAKSENAEAYLYKYLPDGKQEPLNNGLLGSYREKAEEIFGSEEIFVNVLNSSRKLTPITQMLPSERKKIFYYYLGNKLTVFEQYEKIAKERYDKAVDFLDKARQKTVFIDEQLSTIQSKNDIDSRLREIETEKFDCNKKLEEISEKLKISDENLIKEKHRLSLVDVTEKKIKEIEDNITSYEANLEKEKTGFIIKNKNLEDQKLEIEAEVLRKDKILQNGDKISEALKEIQELREIINIVIPKKKLHRASIISEVSKLNADYQELKNKYDARLSEINSRYEKLELEERNRFSQIKADYNLELSENKNIKNTIETKYQNFIKAEEDRYSQLIVEEDKKKQQITNLEIEKEALGKEIINLESDHKKEVTRLESDRERAEKEASQIDRVPCKNIKECTETCEFLLNARTNREMIGKYSEKKNSLEQEFIVKKQELVEKQSLKSLAIQEMQSALKIIDRSETEKTIASIERLRNDELSAVIDPIAPDEKELIGNLNILSLKKDDELSALHEPTKPDTIAQEIEISRIDKEIKESETQGKALKELERYNWEELKKEYDEVQIILPEKKKSLEELKARIAELKDNTAKVQSEINLRISSLKLEVDGLKKESDRSIILTNIASWEQEKKRLNSDSDDNSIKINNYNKEIASLNVINEKRIDLELQRTDQTKEVEDREFQAQRIAFIREGLSKNGIPALIIHNVGLDVAAIANEYLKDGESGLRINFDTLKPNKNGEYRESFDIGIYRGENKIEVQDLSDGETVWIDESISKAMGEYLTDPSRYSKHKYDLDLTDEKDGALSAENKPIFLKLLEQSRRRAKRHYSFVVTHSPEIWKTISQRIHLSKDNGIKIVN